MTASLSPFPAPAQASLFLTSSLGLGFSSLGAGTWLARVPLDTRQLFSCRANIAQGLGHRRAGQVVGKSLHDLTISQRPWPCHGAEPKALRHG